MGAAPPPVASERSDDSFAPPLAVCSAGRCETSGSSDIVALDVNGQHVTVGGAPNQTILLPNGRVIINEQAISSQGRTCAITVNALHVIVNGIADAIISPLPRSARVDSPAKNPKTRTRCPARGLKRSIERVDEVPDFVKRRAGAQPCETPFEARNLVVERGCHDGAVRPHA